MIKVCQDFEHRYQELLDSREAAGEGLRQALDAHAATCPLCEATARRFRLLEQALAEWGPPPSVPDGFTARLLARLDATQPPVPIPFWGRGRRARIARMGAIAAGVMILAVVGWKGRPDRVPSFNAPPTAARVPSPTAPRPLDEALAEARAATLDLAWATSEPAARLGRQMLLTTRTELPETLLRLPSVSTEPAGVLQSGEEKVNVGVEPLTGSARHAFQFLLGPALPRKPDRGA